MKWREILPGCRWTEEEIQYLKESYGKIPTRTATEKVAEKLGRTVSSVHQEARKLNLNAGRKWTEEEIVYLKENYGKIPRENIVKKINRSRNATEQMARKLELRLGVFNKKRKWGDDDIKFFKENYGKIPTKKVAETLGRSVVSMHIRARKLNLRFPEKFDKHPSPALAYILGVIYGDGSVGKWRSGTRHGGKVTYRHSVQLKVLDKEFAESFKAALEKIGLNPFVHVGNHYIFGTRQKSGKKRWEIQANSMPFYMWFTNLTYGKLGKFLSTREMKREFIRGFYESEGSLAKVHKESPKSWYISMGCTDGGIITFVKKIAEDLGFSFHSYERVYKTNISTGKIYYLRLGKFDEIKNFLCQINPVIPRKSIGRITK